MHGHPASKVCASCARGEIVRNRFSGLAVRALRSRGMELHRCGAFPQLFWMDIVDSSSWPLATFTTIRHGHDTLRGR